MAIPMADEKPIRRDIATRFQKGNKLGVNYGRPEEWTEEKLEVEAQALEQWILSDNNYYLTCFATERGYVSSYLDKFAAKSPRFRLTLSRAREVMEARIVKNSLLKKFDGSFAKFVLANKAGWKEKTEVSGDSANPLALVLDKIAKQNQEPIQAQVIEPESIIDQSSSQPVESKPSTQD